LLITCENYTADSYGINRRTLNIFSIDLFYKRTKPKKHVAFVHFFILCFENVNPVWLDLTTCKNTTVAMNVFNYVQSEAELLEQWNITRTLAVEYNYQRES
jgi:hypothetical protein